MKRDLFVKNGTLVMNTGPVQADLLIRGGVIASIGKSLEVSEVRTLDAGGCLVFPGVVDPHVQFEVFHTNVSMTDDFDTGTKAAACGGVTTIIDFADQPKGVDALRYLRERKAVADLKVNVDYTLHMSITDLSGDTLAEIPAIVQEEAVPSFKLYLTYRRMNRMINDGQMFAVMKSVAPAKGIVGVHAESDSLVEYLTEEFVRRGQTDPRYFPQSRPDIAEVISVSAAIDVARATGCDLYIHHVSTALAIDHIARAKREGIRVWAETCPHYLILTDEVYSGKERHLYVMKPPLRSERDRERLWIAVQKGEIDTIGTDHCSYMREQKTKNASFDQTPPGIPGIETLLPVMYTEGVDRGRISLERLLELLCSNPARIFGLFPKKGTLSIGSDGDLVLFDPKAPWSLKAGLLHTNSDFCPFEEMPLAGRVVQTVLRGEVVFENGNFCGTPHGGRFVRGSASR
jgi:dihydropyrimidinase